MAIVIIENATKIYPGGGGHSSEACMKTMVGLGVLLLCISTGCGRGAKQVGTPDEMITQGWECLTISEFDLAAASFSAAVEKAGPDSYEYAIGLYGLGATAQFRRPRSDLAAARVYYGRVRDEDKTGKVAPWGALALVRLEFIAKVNGDARLEKSDMAEEKTREGYRRVMEQFPESWAAQEATLHLAQSLFCTQDGKEAGEAVRLLETLVSKHPDSPYLYGVYGALAWNAYDRGEYMDQYHLMVRQVGILDTKGDPDRYRGDFYYGIAYHAEARLRRPDLAIPWYEKILAGYPEDPRTYQIRAAVERLKKLPVPAQADAPAVQIEPDKETKRHD